jgi:hypothetical protein
VCGIVWVEGVAREEGRWNSCQREDCRKFGNFSHYHLIFVFQLLGQAARNMVLQEDTILHSEDVRNNFFFL